MLTWIDHPGDTASLFHVASSPLGSALRIPAAYDEIRAYSRSKAAVELADGWRRRLLLDGYDAVIESWSESLLPTCTDRESLRLNQLFDLASTWNARRTLRATDFVRFVETQRVAEPSAAPVRVMTVHQSKGLEFDAVVLPELNINLTGQPPVVVVHHPAPGVVPDGVIRYANQTLRPWLPKKVQGWFEQTLGRTVSENLCVLYVAITRARQALYMVVPPNPKERKLPKKYDGLLRAALCDGAVASPDLVLYQDGDETWYRSREKKEEPANKKETQLEPTGDVPAWQKPFPLRSVSQAKHAEVVSPSSLEGGREVPLSKVLQPTNRSGLYFGSLIHKWFEQIEWIEDFQFDSESLQRLASELEPALMPPHQQSQLRTSAMAYFENCLTSETIRKMLSKQQLKQTAAELGVASKSSFEVRVANESSFAVELDGQMMQGTMDRFVEFRIDGRTVAVEIIDFKTDQVDSKHPEAMAARVDYYRPQMQAYRQAASAMTGAPLACVRAQLLFVDPKSPMSFAVM